MVRKLSLLLGLFFAISLTAHAQGDKVEVFGGFSYERFASTNTAGWELSGQYKWADWIGGVADLDGHYGSGNSVHTFLFGPQVSWPARISPFAHVLIGGAHISGNGASNTSFSSAIGAGIDARVAPGISWRVIQGDYLVTHFYGGTQNNGRISTGIVFHF